MSLINLTPIHYLSLIYISFAHQTDGVFSRDEQTSVWKSIKKWIPEDFDNSDFLKIMDETMEWYKTIFLEEDFQETVFDIANKMNEYDWFTKQKKEDSLKDLKKIALSDKKFIDNEKKWIRHIAKLWSVDTKFVNKTLK